MILNTKLFLRHLACSFFKLTTKIRTRKNLLGQQLNEPIQSVRAGSLAWVDTARKEDHFFVFEFARCDAVRKDTGVVRVRFFFLFRQDAIHGTDRDDFHLPLLEAVSQSVSSEVQIGLRGEFLLHCVHLLDRFFVGKRRRKRKVGSLVGRVAELVGERQHELGNVRVLAVEPVVHLLNESSPLGLLGWRHFENGSEALSV